MTQPDDRGSKADPALGTCLGISCCKLRFRGMASGCSMYVTLCIIEAKAVLIHSA